MEWPWVCVVLNARRRLVPSNATIAALQIVVDGDDGLKQEESEFNPDFIAHLLPKLDWAALRKTASEVRGPGLSACACDTRAFGNTLGLLVRARRVTRGPRGRVALLNAVTVRRAVAAALHTSTHAARHRGTAGAPARAAGGGRGAAEEHPRPHHGRECTRATGISSLVGGGVRSVYSQVAAREGRTLKGCT